MRMNKLETKQLETKHMVILIVFGMILIIFGFVIYQLGLYEGHYRTLTVGLSYADVKFVRVDLLNFDKTYQNRACNIRYNDTHVVSMYCYSYNPDGEFSLDINKELRK